MNLFTHTDRVVVLTRLSSRDHLTFDNMDESNRRIVILGKTGAGKSSLANTIFGKKMFKINHTFNSGTSECEAKTKSVNGRSITLIDTPGFFDTERSEEKLKTEIVRCITECAPGPHAFLIVLKVEKFTELEQAVINKINEYFSEEAFKYATVVFTQGDQLPEGQTIEDYVHQNKLVSDLVKKCGGRCLIIDNKYWNQNPNHEYRSNQLQVEELLKTIDKIIEANNGRCYTNQIVEAVEIEIEQEEENIRLLPGNMSEEEIREQAKGRVFEKLVRELAGILTGALLGAFFGVVVVVGGVATVLRESSEPVQLRGAIAETATVIGRNVCAGTSIGQVPVVGATIVAAAGLPLLTIIAALAATGAMKGVLIGHDASQGADKPREAAERTMEAVKNEAQSALNETHSVLNKMSQTKKKTPLV
ncbi:GTPase IMAP family member 7-like [Larimichthys crocea]|uniref:GTPase IMAP family member 7-like n=1 Tax=Larimichthys crocea TaxID=215358 RepID=UPI000F5FBB51|nr:GTPase IMAP family member 7-like [Larimichthys crocea]